MMSKLKFVSKNSMKLFKSISVRKNSVWTNVNVVRSPFNDVVIPHVTINEYLLVTLDKWPSKIASVCGITNRSYTYENIYKRSQTFGANLRQKLGINDGDVVAIMTYNSPEYPIVVKGILAAGGIVSGFNPVSTAYEVQRQIELSEARLMIAHPDVVPVVRTAITLLKKDIKIITLDIENPLPDGTISYKELIDDVHVDLDVLREVRRDVNDVAFLPYSSGTTGLPKGVELTNRNVLANFEQQNTECRQHVDTTESHQDTELILLPMFHSYGLLIAMLHKMSVGLKMVTLPKFKAETFLNTLMNYKVNVLHMAPPMVLFLGSHALATPKYLENLTFIVCGAAPLAAADIDKFVSKLKPESHFGQGYGMTETGPLSTITPRGFKNMTTVGLPLPNVELRIVDSDMKNLGPNAVGELLIKGPNVMKGYKNNEKANKEIFLDNGWLRSGDIGSIDENGCVYISDRLKELIKINAYQVAPAELESVIKEHPSVFDAAVVGIPDDVTGQRPKAFVVLNKETQTRADDIKDFVKQKVSPYKQIKEIMFIDSIPKNPSGKILRKILKEKYC